MTLPLLDKGMISGLVLGFLFGLVLEGAGFGSPRKLTSQFLLRDFAVFKVMFTAVIVAAIGLWLSDMAGVMTSGRTYIPTLFFWTIALGGALIGVGFVLGGYCPGTSAAGLASGRLDALVFMAGMVIGVWIFAAVFEWLEPFYRAARGPARQTLDQLLGVPTFLVVSLLVVVAVGGFLLGTRLERRFGGPIRAEHLSGAEPRQPGPAEPYRRKDATSST